MRKVEFQPQNDSVITRGLYIATSLRDLFFSDDQIRRDGRIDFPTFLAGLPHSNARMDLAAIRSRYETPLKNTEELKSNPFFTYQVSAIVPNVAHRRELDNPLTTNKLVVADGTEMESRDEDPTTIAVKRPETKIIMLASRTFGKQNFDTLRQADWKGWVLLHLQSQSGQATIYSLIGYTPSFDTPDQAVEHYLPLLFAKKKTK